MTRTRLVKGKITERTGGNEIYYAEGDIVINAGEMISITSAKGVIFDNPEKAPNNEQTEVSLKIIKDTFLPLGLKNFKGETENDKIKFEILSRKGTAKGLTFLIKHNGNTLVTKNIDAIAVGEKALIEWNGFSDAKIYDSTVFNEGELIVEVTGADNEVKETINAKYKKVKWVDIKIDDNSKNIDVTLRVNLKDGGVIGDGVPKYTFSDLESMALEGLKTYWSRNRTRTSLIPPTDFVTINNEEYLVTVNALNSQENAMDDINLTYNSETKRIRSSNPGSVTGVLSFFANIFVPERVVFNSQSFSEERDFKLTAAHEIGHELIKTFGGEGYSYAHEGSSTLLTQQQKNNPLPLTGENNLMEYYSDSYYDFDRTLAAEKDVLGLLWCSIIKIK
ncbi:hypothetical protein LXD69_08140 [Flavobacterium sediminilitoris]|uniref:Uncharacterized protein n=1 Tax=Flavobacterium sediminilitoris TaxID=2024526 RepID=A0ABY4HUU0_9FLAO|nr:MULTISPECIES: hypothetical protein [Flavobacterium]UOX35479.1 hypothetical protein LXD69_08140 [Flavobacterium sediminilitoris]